MVQKPWYVKKPLDLLWYVKKISPSRSPFLALSVALPGFVHRLRTPKSDRCRDSTRSTPGVLVLILNAAISAPALIPLLPVEMCPGTRRCPWPRRDHQPRGGSPHLARPSGGNDQDSRWPPEVVIPRRAGGWSFEPGSHKPVAMDLTGSAMAGPPPSCHGPHWFSHGGASAKPPWTSLIRSSRLENKSPIDMAFWGASSIDLAQFLEEIQGDLQR
jgi:hypothetical protein